MRSIPHTLRSTRPKIGGAAVLVALLAAGTAGCGDDSADAVVTPGPQVRLAAPADGAHIAGSFAVRMAADGVTIEPAGDVHPGAGHFHVMVDNQCIAAGKAIPKDGGHRHFGQGQTDSVLSLTSGEHRLCLQVGDGAHVATGLTDEITVTVGVTTLDEWCGVVREVGAILDTAQPDGELAEIQPANADVVALLDQLRDGLGLIDAERRQDITTVIDVQSSLSQAVVDATDADAMHAAIDELSSEELDVDESTFEWLATTCGLEEASATDAIDSGAIDSDAADSDAVPLVAPTSHGDVGVIVDQSPTVSDVGALALLAARGDVDLLAVTLPGTGESDCGPGAVTTRAVLDAAGRSDVPIGCGDDRPIGGANEWPAEWRAAANSLAGVVAPGVDATPYLEAELLLADALAAATAPVTIVALGPLTNVAAALRDDPSLTERIERIVVMGGAVSVPGNVESAPNVEWNFYADSVAAREVIGSGVPVVLVPLDATDSVPLTAGFAHDVGVIDNPLAELEADVIGSLPSLDGMFMWDELAAVVAVQPEVATWSTRTIAIADNGSTIALPGATSVQVATAADAPSVRSIVLDALSEPGGVPSP